MLCAVLPELVLREERMQLHLVDCRHNFPRLAQFLQVGNRPISNANGFDFSRLVDLFHLAPGLALIPLPVDRSCTIRIDRKKLTRLVL